MGVDLEEKIYLRRNVSTERLKKTPSIARVGQPCCRLGPHLSYGSADNTDHSTFLQPKQHDRNWALGVEV